MMRKVYITLIFTLLSLLLSAQHYFGVTIGGLTVSQFDNIDNTSSRLGGGGEIGAVYQLKKNKFLFQTGLGFTYSASVLGLDSMHLSANMIDTEGTNFTYRGIIYDRKDRLNVAELSVPLMFGFNVSSFYALVGAKFICPLVVTTHQTALLTSYGDYNGMFYEDFMNMPQHGYANAQSIDTKGKANLLYDVMPCVELGGRWSVAKTTRKRKSLTTQIAVGFFAEYGLLNTLKGGNNDLVDVDYSQYMNVEMNHIYTTLSRNSAFINNLRIGLRGTVLFPIADFNKRSRKCMCIRHIYRKRLGYRRYR